MAALPEQVRHDAASLYQFVCSIVDLCESRNPAAAYLSSSERFFDYLVELGRATKDYVRQFPGGRTQPAEYLDHAMRLLFFALVGSFFTRSCAPPWRVTRFIFPAPCSRD